MFVRCDSGLAEQLGLFPKGESHMGPPPLGQSVALTPSQNANSDHNVRLFNKSLAGYDLSGARLDDVRLSGWNLSSAICRGTSFRKVILNRRSNLKKCDLTGALLVETDLTDAALEGAVFSNARVERTALVRAKLCGVKATNVVFTDVSIEGADIQGADFQFAVDSGTPAQIDAIRRSCCNWRLAKFDVATLRQLGLNPLEHNAPVTLGAQNNVYDFTKGDLSGCNLIGANLAGAILRGATPVGAQLEGASLEGADLRMADLRQAQLRRAILSRADMTDAKLQNAAFDGTDLSQVKGLTVEQLADTSLIDVILPAHVSNFTGVTSIEGLTKVSRGFFIVQILLCLFAFFTAKSINDGDLLANRRILSWPSLEMSTTLLLFFQWSPLILLAINLWANILL
jgi:uncharacterized protein YjbI with pentapeptide repeats